MTVETVQPTITRSDPANHRLTVAFPMPRPGFTNLLQRGVTSPRDFPSWHSSPRLVSLPLFEE